MSTQTLLHQIDLLESRKAKVDLSLSHSGMSKGILCKCRNDWVFFPDVQDNAEPAAAGPVQPSLPSGNINSSDSHAAMKFKKDISDSEVKNRSLKLSTQEERAETSSSGVRCAVCQGTGAVICTSQKSLRGVREHNSTDK